MPPSLLGSHDHGLVTWAMAPRVSTPDWRSEPEPARPRSGRRAACLGVRLEGGSHVEPGGPEGARDEFRRGAAGRIGARGGRPVPCAPLHSPGALCFSRSLTGSLIKCGSDSGLHCFKKHGTRFEQLPCTSRGQAGQGEGAGGGGLVSWSAVSLWASNRVASVSSSVKGEIVLISQHHSRIK